jgi:hypothetical protein
VDDADGTVGVEPDALAAALLLLLLYKNLGHL